MSNDCWNVISEMSLAARVVVHYQQAYDVLDEMVRFAETPDKALVPLYRLCRLVTKTAKDIMDDDSLSEETKNKALKRLEVWSDSLEKALESCFKDKDGPKWIREFAALAVSPDHYIFEVLKQRK
ncbi:hypothetical protein [Infirmifilum sp.]|uniref:hypothetical protein n=1 Tax=Infirmifilum sp. TaxID=2856575 RepID=UPI003D13BFA2